MELYEYQVRMRDEALDALSLHDSVMCQMPTGTGKTVVLAAVINEFARGRREPVWVIAHRRELVEQIERTWRALFADSNDAPQVRVLSIQWLARNWHRIDTMPCMVVVDEAHHAVADSYRSLWERLPGVKKLGMTATPYRLNGAGFGDLFEDLLVSKSIPDFILMRRLSLFDYYCVPQDSKIRRQIALLRKRGTEGDFQTKEMADSLNTPRHIEYLYNSLHRYAWGRRGIVYAINIEHARAIAAHYAARGLRCCAIDCHTPAAERAELVEAFRQGCMDVMVNVDIFSEGFDCPEVEFIQLARPTLSLAVYLQQVGRGLRRAKGKRKCVILDNVGLCRTFGTPIRRWNWEGMFRGQHGALRMDLGERQSLVKRLGYPGRLEDEPMEKVISHTDMDQAIRCQSLLAYAEGSDLVGVRMGGRVVARLPIERILQYRNDIAAVLLRDGSKVLVFGNGKTYTLREDFREFRVLDDGILRIEGASGVSHLDLFTGREYGAELRVAHVGGIELVEVGWSLRPRFGNGLFTDFRAYEVSEASWHGFYFRAKQAEDVFDPAVYVESMTRRNPWDRPSVDTVLLPNDGSSYYFVADLPDGSIVIATVTGEYYRVRADVGKELLFEAATYGESRRLWERWRASFSEREPATDSR